LPWLDVAFGFAIAQASQIAGITPGNWGIAEWSWTGALVALGHGLSLAAGFALALRVVSFLGVLVVLAAAWVAHRALDQRSPQSSGADRPAAR
ncbi:MAG: hypothetical protein HKM95_10195, partial [Inquilinus sp.]|nr:hypothetical protein [Inquilinus sp.]